MNQASLKIGINGFGRIGRLVMRVAAENPGVAIVHINDPAGDADTLAHLLHFDSVHGRSRHEASVDGGVIRFAGFSASVSHNKTIAETDWSGCDVVIEASGRMKSKAVLRLILTKA